MVDEIGRNFSQNVFAKSLKYHLALCLGPESLDYFHYNIYGESVYKNQSKSIEKFQK